MKNRTITFGKYKGQPIKKLILQHIGYIMWCLSNCTWFSLTEEEQAIYDAVAIANIKYGIKMVFSDESMLAFVKDKKKLDNRETPFIVRGDGMIQINSTDKDNPIVTSVLPFFKIKPIKKNSISFLPELSTVVNKIIDNSFPEWQEVEYDDF